MLQTIFMQDREVTEVTFEIFNFKCFDEAGSGEIRLLPINFVIGRNNAGKSAIVDFIEIFLSNSQPYDNLKHSRHGNPPSFHLSDRLREVDLRPAFRENTSGGQLNGNHWAIGSTLKDATVTLLNGPDLGQSITRLENPTGLHPDILDAACIMLSETIKWPLNGLGMTRVAAERDVRPEQMSNAQNINASGAGLTNAIARQISEVSLKREVIQELVLGDLNEIYQGDAEFTEILTRIDGQNNWEVYLSEKDKGDIRLSESGSGLKTALLITTLIRLRPTAQWSRQIFAIDEPENNLHPALFRRLLEYLARVQEECGFVLLVTTHSSVGIDWAARRANSQVIHVTHDGVSAKARIADGYAAGRDILDDLDIRASDLLQANGIIWVEGPSDRIYLRRWLDLYSDHTLKEGIHYRIMFYGGKLLSHLNGNSPEAESDLIALLAMNRHAALLIDSDRRLAGATKKGALRKPRMHINGTKKRIKEELEAQGGLVWITEGKEVENYIPIGVFAALIGQSQPTVTEFDSIVELPLLRSFQDKVKLAHAVSAVLKREDLSNILDLEVQLEKLAARIRFWNGIAN